MVMRRGYEAICMRSCRAANLSQNKRRCTARDSASPIVGCVELTELFGGNKVGNPAQTCAFCLSTVMVSLVESCATIWLSLRRRQTL